MNLINSFDFLNLKGKIKMINPDVSFVVYYYHDDNSCLVNCWFGTLVSFGVRNTNIISNFDLKKRDYLGTTSFDPELSLIMSNMALVDNNSFVIDPFVGTGSFLYTTSYFGAFSFGCDIDKRQMVGTNAYSKSLEKKSQSNGKSRVNEEKIKLKNSRSIFSCIEQYGLEKNVVGTMVSDFAHSPWREAPLFDAILSDPPYGVRAGAKTVGVGPLENKSKHPNLVPYEIDQLVFDLFDFAKKHLVVGGRLAFWYPTTSEYQEGELPSCPGLIEISNCEQDFGKWTRRLVVMERVEGDGQVMDGKKTSYNFRETYFS